MYEICDKKGTYKLIYHSKFFTNLKTVFDIFWCYNNIYQSVSVNSLKIIYMDIKKTIIQDENKITIKFNKLDCTVEISFQVHPRSYEIIKSLMENCIDEFIIKKYQVYYSDYFIKNNRIFPREITNIILNYSHQYFSLLNDDKKIRGSAHCCDKTFKEIKKKLKTLAFSYQYISLQGTIDFDFHNSHFVLTRDVLNYTEITIEADQEKKLQQDLDLFIRMIED